MGLVEYSNIETKVYESIRVFMNQKSGFVFKYKESVENGLMMIFTILD